MENKEQNNQSSLQNNVQDKDVEENWYKDVYNADKTPQLTLRALLTGMLLGSLMSSINLLIGLQLGVGIGVGIIAVLIAYTIFYLFSKLRICRPLGILENVTVQTSASIAAYMASAALVSAIPALLILADKIEVTWLDVTLTFAGETQVISWFVIVIWVIIIALIGVALAIPLKREMINKEKLPFPYGIAAAETLKSLHLKSKDSNEKIYWLIGTAVVAFIFEMIKIKAPFTLIEAIECLPRDVYCTFVGTTIGLVSIKTIGFGVTLSLTFVGVGMLIGMRVSVSMLVGGIVAWLIIAPNIVPELHQMGIFGKTPLEKIPWREIMTSWFIWPGVAIMVTSSFTSFFMQSGSIVKAISKLLKKSSTTKDDIDELAKSIEIPFTWFIWLFGIAGSICVFLQWYIFDIPVWLGIIAVLISLILGLIAARSAGETGIAPIGALGKITQFIYALLSPGNTITNLMTASITAGAANNSGDLLTDLKTGYLLGASPRKQLIAQLFGGLLGAFVVVGLFVLLLHQYKIGGEVLPAPAAQMWAKVAEVLTQGIEMPPYGLLGVAIAGGLGILFAILDKTVPKKFKIFVPSSIAIGLAFMLPFKYLVPIAIGGIAVSVLGHFVKNWTEKNIMVVAAGLLIGETIMMLSWLTITVGLKYI